MIESGNPSEIVSGFSQALAVKFHCPMPFDVAMNNESELNVNPRIAFDGSPANNAPTVNCCDVRSNDCTPDEVVAEPNNPMMSCSAPDESTALARPAWLLCCAPVIVIKSPVVASSFKRPLPVVVMYKSAPSSNISVVTAPTGVDQPSCHSIPPDALYSPFRTPPCVPTQIVFPSPSIEVMFPLGNVAYWMWVSKPDALYLRIELTPVEPPACARCNSPPVYWKLVTAVLNGASRTCPVNEALVWRYEKLVVEVTVKPKIPVLMNNIPSE